MPNEHKSHKLSANWLKAQPIKFIESVVIKLFPATDPQCMFYWRPILIIVTVLMFLIVGFKLSNQKHKLKKDIVLIAYNSFGWTIDCTATAKLSFNHSELIEIEEPLNKIKDVDYDLYYFLIGQQRYMENEQFMQTIDFLIEDCDFITFINSIWNLFKSILHEHPKAAEFEHKFQHLYLKSDEYVEIKVFKQLYDDKFDLKGKEISDDAIDLIEKGLPQIIDYKGLTFDRALEGLTIRGFYYFMHLFYFERRRQLATFFDNYTIDHILLKNTITGDEMWLANKVPKITDKEIEKFKKM